MPQPYWSSDDGRLTLYLGRAEDILPALALRPDLVVADPPYGSTPLAWDRWPDGWPRLIADHTTAPALWSFGTLRIFLDRGSEFVDAGWKFSHDVVWEKHNGTGFATDRFRCVHELAGFWYRGPWSTTYHDVPSTPYTGPDKHTRARASRGRHYGDIGAHVYRDDGTRLARSVIKIPSVRGGIHETQKPVDLVELMIRYGCPPAGLVLDPFAGSGSTLEAARRAGRRAVGIEWREECADAAATRLASQLPLEIA